MRVEAPFTPVQERASTRGARRLYRATQLRSMPNHRWASFERRQNGECRSHSSSPEGSSPRFPRGPALLQSASSVHEACCGHEVVPLRRGTFQGTDQPSPAQPSLLLPPPSLRYVGAHRRAPRSSMLWLRFGTISRTGRWQGKVECMKHSSASNAGTLAHAIDRVGAARRSASRGSTLWRPRRSQSCRLFASLTNELAACCPLNGPTGRWPPCPRARVHVTRRPHAMQGGGQLEGRQQVPAAWPPSHGWEKRRRVAAHGSHAERTRMRASTRTRTIAPLQPSPSSCDYGWVDTWPRL